jgi:hypothetical protein
MALFITALVGTATVGMLNAVSVGIDSRHDHRTATIRAHHAQTRLASYIASSRCLLHHNANMIVLWIDDSRMSDTVHISEVRWLVFDAQTGEITVHFVVFPSGLSDWMLTQLDLQYPAASDWAMLFQHYQSHAFLNLASTKLIDGLVAAAPFLDDSSNVLDARHVTYHLLFETRSGEYASIASAAIRQHRKPAR